MKKIVLMFATVLFAIPGNSQTYNMDKNHSKLVFSVMHFGISHVEGNFKNFEATLKSTKDDFSDAMVEMTADAGSIDTDVDMRDKDLKSENFLDVEKYPKITFKSTSFKKVSDKKYKMEGNITIHGVTKPIVFEVVYNGKAQNPMSKKNLVGFTVNGKLNRKDFNVGNGPSSMAVGNEIDVRSNVEFIME
ncbi:MAG: YceI family protein [Bacteroidia bacterium]